MSERGSLIVAIDSMVLVWGMRGEGSQDQIKRARWLFLELEEEKAQVLIPSVALSEYLSAIAVAKQAEVVAVLSRRFVIPPFDVRCAALAAKMYQEGRTDRGKTTKAQRRCLRADSLILATAAVHGATVFYSNDSRCRKLALQIPRMEGKDLPTVGPSLWDNGS